MARESTVSNRFAQFHWFAISIACLLGIFLSTDSPLVLFVFGALLIELFLVFRPLMHRMEEAHQKALRESEAKELVLSQLQSLTDEQERAIEEQKLSLELLQIASRRFQELFHGVPFPCLSIDREFNVFEWNQECESLFGIRAFEAFEQNIFSLIISGSAETRVRELLLKTFAGESIRGENLVLTTRAGEERHMIVSLFPVRGANNLITGAIISAADVTTNTVMQLQLEEQVHEIADINVLLEIKTMELEEMAFKDALTGLKNHRAFRESLVEVIRGSPPVSVILLDVDKFKMFNDTFGHQAGDEVLRRVAQCIAANTASEFCVARYGGEEFVVVLQGLNNEEALFEAERMRRQIEEAEWPDRQVTASFGVATWTEGMCNQNDLIESADQALYASKESGRNCVTSYSQLKRKLSA